MLVIFAVIIGGIATGACLSAGASLSYRASSPSSSGLCCSCWGSRWAPTLRSWARWRRSEGRRWRSSPSPSRGASSPRGCCGGGFADAPCLPTTGGRRRCPGFRMVGPLRQSRDRRLLRGGMYRGTFRAVRYRRIAGQRLRALCADVLRGDHAGQRPHAGRTGSGGSIRGWRCCPSPQPSGRWPGPLWRLRCSPNGR